MATRAYTSYQAFPLSETPSLGVRGARARSNTCIRTDRYEQVPSSERFSRERFDSWAIIGLVVFFWRLLLKVSIYLQVWAVWLINV